MSALRYTINKADDGKYIVLKCIGIIDPPLLLGKIIEADALGRRLGIDRYLVDLTEARRENSVFADYRFVNTDMKDAGIDKTSQVALVVDPDDHSHDFLETVLLNGGYDVKLFTDCGLAERHLDG